MILPSRLAHTTLGDLLGGLHRQRATGVLVLQEPQGRRHAVELQQGLVSAIELDRASPSLADVLRAQEAGVDEGTLRRSLLRALASSRRHGEVLVRDFHVSPSVVSAALRRQLGLRLQALESVRDARISFRPGALQEASMADAAPLAPAEFLHGRRRARDRAHDSGGASPAPSSHELLARQVLGVGAEASELELKRAYRKLVHALHPDLHPGLPADERARRASQFAQATAAYRSLTG